MSVAGVPLQSGDTAAMMGYASASPLPPFPPYSANFNFQAHAHTHGNLDAHLHANAHANLQANHAYAHIHDLHAANANTQTFYHTHTALPTASSSTASTGPSLVPGTVPGPALGPGQGRGASEPGTATLVGFSKPRGQRKSAASGNPEHVKHRRTRSGCLTCRSRRVKVRERFQEDRQGSSKFDNLASALSSC